jgi:hypothetical protein
MIDKAAECVVKLAGPSASTQRRVHRLGLISFALEVYAPLIGAHRGGHAHFLDKRNRSHHTSRFQETLEQLVIWRPISKGMFPSNVPQHDVPHILEAVVSSGEYVSITGGGW